jgi:hypothetical protein
MNMKLLQPVQHTPRCSKYKHIPYTCILTKLGKFLENGLVIRVGVEKILKKNFIKMGLCQRHWWMLSTQGLVDSS